MNCVECSAESKYKCPICRVPYCSVTCCKKHKANPCTANIITQETSKLEAIKEPLPYDFPTSDTVPAEKLKLLETSKDLEQLLVNPHLRTILELLDKAPNPDVLMSEYMKEPIFTEFVDECLRVIEPARNNT